MANANSSFSRNELTAVQFDELLRRLDADRERAGTKYEEIRWKLIRFFQWNSCMAAEELVDETLNRVAERLAERGEAIEDVAAFAWGVAKKLRQEAFRREAKMVFFPDIPDAENLTVERAWSHVAGEHAHDDRRLRCLRMCIQYLATGERRLLMAYHAPRQGRVQARLQLARQNGITMTALRVRINRLRFKLEECMKRRLATATN